MSIQSNINNTISLVSLLLTQMPKKEKSSPKSREASKKAEDKLKELLDEKQTSKSFIETIRKEVGDV